MALKPIAAPSRGIASPAMGVRGLVRTGMGLVPVVKPSAQARQAGDDLIAAMTVKPTAGRRDAIIQLIAELMLYGVWDKLDCLYLFASHNSQAGLLNWKNPTVPASNPGGQALIWTVDVGVRGVFGGNNTAPANHAYVRDNTGNLNALAKFSQNNGHIMVANATDAPVGLVGCYVNTGSWFIFPGTPTRTYTGNAGVGNGGGEDAINGGNDQVPWGSIIASRTGALVGDARTYHNGRLVTVGVQSSAAPPALPFRWCGYYDYGFGSFQDMGSDGQQAAGSVGASLTEGEAFNYHTALARYLRALGNPSS